MCVRTLEPCAVLDEATNTLNLRLPAVAENVILSHNREYVITEFGESSYHGAYNTLSTMATARCRLSPFAEAPTPHKELGKD